MNPDGVWHKSSYSSFEGNCLEMAEGWLTVAIRDSKNPGPVLRFSPDAWRKFVDSVKAGELIEPHPGPNGVGPLVVI